jgi:glycosyltransferase involved in cell wall biosynthesis
MEAMAMQVPCVSTNIAGIPELIGNEVDGLLVAASDEGALADAIARLMDDPDLRRRIGTAARERVLREYDLTRNTLRLAEVFARRLASAGR